METIKRWLCDNCSTLNELHRLPCRSCGFIRFPFRHATDPFKLNKRGQERAR